MPLNIPVNTIEPIDINELIKQFSAQSEAELAAQDRYAATEKDLSSSVNSEVDAIRKEAELGGALQKGVDDILIGRAQRNKETAAFFGMNPEAHNSIIQGIAQSLLSQEMDLQKSGQAIAEKQSTKFLDDPMQWMINAFTVPAEIQQHNTKVAIFERQVEALDKLGKLADSQIARNNAIDANTTAQLSAITAERMRAAAEIRVQDARQKAMQMGTQLTSIRLAATQQQFANSVSLHNASVSLQALELQRQTKDINEESKELQKRNLQLLIDKKEEDAAAAAQLQTNLDRATSILGMRRVSVNEYDKAPQRMKQALFEVMSDPNIQQGRLGYDTVNALEVADNLNAPLTPSTTEVKNMLTRWSAEASANPVFAALKPGEKHGKTQEHLMNKVKVEAGNIPDAGGLYSAPSIASVNQIPAVSNTILWKSTFATQAVNKTRPTSAQAVYDAALGLIADNKMDLERAASEVAIIYKSIAIDNTQQRDYNRFALPMQNNYRTSIRIASGLFEGTKIVDMTDPVQVKNNLMRSLAAQRMEKGVPGFGVYP